MTNEIELRYGPFTDYELTKLSQRALALGAEIEFAGRVQQNYYFDTANTACSLRLRDELGTTVMVLKTGADPINGYIRKEHTLKLGCTAEEASNILLATGFVQLNSIWLRSRTQLKLFGATICLDTSYYGNIVEIEGSSEKHCLNVASKLLVKLKPFEASAKWDEVSANWREYYNKYKYLLL